MKRILLVAATTGYQTRMFADAGRRLGIELVLATDRCHVLEDPWGDHALPVRFEDLPASADQLRAWLKQQDPLFGPKIPGTQQELERYAKWISEFLAQQNYREPVVGKLTSDNPPDLIILFRPAAARPSVARVSGEL